MTRFLVLAALVVGCGGGDPQVRIDDDGEIQVTSAVETATPPDEAAPAQLPEQAAHDVPPTKGDPSAKSDAGQDAGTEEGEEEECLPGWGYGDMNHCHEHQKQEGQE